MSTYYPHNDCDTVPAYTCPGDDCPPVIELGNIRGQALVKKTFTFTDPTNPTEWLAGIASGDIIIIPLTNGECTTTPVTTKGYGDTEEIVIGHDLVFNIEDGNYLSNVGFYNGLQRTNNWRIAVRTNTYTWLTDLPASVSPGFKIENGVKTKVGNTIAYKVTQPNLPEPFATPAGVFECQ